MQAGGHRFDPDKLHHLLSSRRTPFGLAPDGAAKNGRRAVARVGWLARRLVVKEFEAARPSQMAGTAVSEKDLILKK